MIQGSSIVDTTLVIKKFEAVIKKISLKEWKKANWKLKKEFTVLILG